MRAALTSLALSLAVAGAARADETPSETRWYGWQIMLADAAGGALLYAGSKGNSAASIAGVSILVLGSPVIHLAHHAPGDAGWSVLARVVPFGASLAIFAAIHPPCGEGCGELAIPVSGLILSGVGAVADWIYLSSERVDQTVSLGPAVPFDRRRGAGLALTLRF
ncbi:MAG TPA: hypothetical protein VE964_05295 [Myxococcales bacterium]|nr:hypothetical protein [Myxococcales bacterium]